MTVLLDQAEPDPQQVIADLKRQLAESSAERDTLRGELVDAYEQQAATAEVLKAISRSNVELETVLNTLVRSVTRLCGADHAWLFQRDDRIFRWAASFGHTADVHERIRDYFQPLEVPVDMGSVTGRAALQGRVVHVPDVLADREYTWGDAQKIGGYRTALGVPLFHKENVVGVIFVGKTVPQPFTAKQIELVTTFADQAVIAMENARLLTETREALEQQTATAEVLQVINSNPGDLDPVFNAILEKAHTLCGAAHGHLSIYDGEQFRAAATQGVPDSFAELLRQPFRPGLRVGQRLLAGEAVIHIPDMAAQTYALDDRIGRAAVEIGGVRTLLIIPLRKDSSLLGYVTAHRTEVRPFTDSQIALLQSFAAQAVIAMENARLITETREALEQQTATAEVLQVINASPGDLTPVFDAMLEKAMRLCEAQLGFLSTYDGQLFDAVAMRGVPEAYASEYFAKPYMPARGTTHDRIVRGEEVVHVADLSADPVDSPRRRAVIEVLGARTIAGIALRKEGELVGALHLYRQEVRPFTDKQIALLQSFAAQAVIAMENARLITETREALEQQTATAEVLGVINASPGDVAPVFDAMLDKAMRLCEAETAHLLRYEGGAFSRAASRGISEDFDRLLPLNVPVPSIITRHSVPYRTVETRSTVNIPDLRLDYSYRAGAPAETGAVEKHGARSVMFVPLLKEGDVVGCFVMHRREVRPFSEKHIALMQNFAAQAVIAMDNARLLNEIRQRQAELRVTFDNMGDGVAMFDADLHLAAWNMNFQQILGLPDEFVAERPTSTDLIRYLAQHGEFGAVDVEAEVRRIADRMDQQWSTERIRPDGRVIEVRNNPVPDGGFVLIYSDVTERKRAEEEIRTARDAAEKALAELRTAQASLIHAEKMASLGQLTAGIAHEIKNPLNFVNNFAGLSIELLDELKETAAPGFATLDDNTRADVDETVEMLTGNLEKIAEHGKRADGIVKSMLEHSRGLAGERRAVDLNALLDEALNLAYHGARAQDQSFNITMEREFDRSLSLTEVVPQDMTRVFLNLISNGFYAATRRKQQGDAAFSPVLKVATRDLGDAVEIRIRDNGVGIPPEHRDKLFQPFFTTKPTGEGTGLGLSISYDIVTQEHGGTITVESEPGQFTEFSVRLPQRQQSSAA